jgi:hypothetical protein
VKYSESEGAEKISGRAFERAVKDEKISVSGDQEFINRAQNPRTQVGLRKAIGGSSAEGLQENISNLERSKNILQKWVAAKRRLLSSAEELLRKREKGG